MTERDGEIGYLLDMRSALLSGLVVVAALMTAVVAQEMTRAPLEETVAPGNNYDKAEFRLYVPNDVPTLRGVVVLVPGSNGDGRPMADDPFWREFAARQKVALVGCRFTDKPHDQAFIEHYVNVSQGSGQA